MSPVSLLIAVALTFIAPLALVGLSSALPEPDTDTNAVAIRIDNPGAPDSPIIIDAGILSDGVATRNTAVCAPGGAGFVSGWNCAGMRVRSAIVKDSEDHALAVRRIIRADYRSDLPAGADSTTGRVTTVTLSADESRAIDPDLAPGEVIAGVLLTPAAGAEDSNNTIITFTGPEATVSALIDDIHTQAA